MHFRIVDSTKASVVANFTHVRNVRNAAGESKDGKLYSRAQTVNSSILKRSFDIVGASTLLLFLFPSLALVAIYIRLETPGPALFRQQRFGRHGKVFTLLKFRSMTVQESEGSFSQAQRADPRVTPFGRWLRQSSIDELPQLVNVVKGEMSLVGPRPHALAMDQYYAGLIPKYSDRLLVRPGLTGLAQISGFRGPTNTIEAMSRRLWRDRAYLRQWTPLLDLKILMRTPRSLFGPNAL